MPMRKKYEPLRPGQWVGEWELISTYMEKRIRYWCCRCSCGTLKNVQDRNLKTGGTTKCKFHKRNLIKKLGLQIRQVEDARQRLKKKYELDPKWSKDIVAFALVYCAKYAGERLEPIDTTKPIGPNNYHFVSIPKVAIDCKAARDRAAKWLGPKAYEVTKQYIYQFLRKKERSNDPS